MRSILAQEKNPALREKAREIPLSDIKSARTRKLVADMKKLLAAEEYGVALAAPQVGEALRLFVVSGKALLRQAQDKSPNHPATEYQQSDETPPPAQGGSALGRDQVYINPVMTKVSRAKSDKHEGCLSIRGKWGEVARAEKATVQAYDEHGRTFMRGASGFLAHIFQHEMDHLEGILYTDKATHVYEEHEEKSR